MKTTNQPSKYDKDVFILVHGWGGSAKSLAALARCINVLFSGAFIKVIELPGHGQTRLPKVFKMQDYGDYVVDEIANYLAKLPKPSSSIKLNLVGHSFGGKTLLYLATNHKLPNNSEIFLINSSGIAPKVTFKVKVLLFITKILKPIKAHFPTFIRNAFYKYIVRTTDYKNTAENPLLRTTFQQVIAENIAPTELTKINEPTHLIWGELDKYTPLYMGRVLQQYIPNCTLDIVPNATHGLPLRQPEAVGKIIMKYLTK